MYFIVIMLITKQDIQLKYFSQEKIELAQPQKYVYCQLNDFHISYAEANRQSFSTNRKHLKYSHKNLKFFSFIRNSTRKSMQPDQTSLTICPTLVSDLATRHLDHANFNLQYSQRGLKKIVFNQFVTYLTIFYVLVLKKPSENKKMRFFEQVQQNKSPKISQIFLLDSAGQKQLNLAVKPKPLSKLNKDGKFEPSKFSQIISQICLKINSSNRNQIGNNSLKTQCEGVIQVLQWERSHQI